MGIKIGYLKITFPSKFLRLFAGVASTCQYLLRVGWKSVIYCILNRTHFNKHIDESFSLFHEKYCVLLLKQLTVATVGGILLSAVCRVEEEYRYLQEPVPIPRHPAVERTAVTLDQP